MTPQTLNQAVADKIRKTLVDLIPEKEWQAVIDREVSNFKEEILPCLVRELLTEHYLVSLRQSVDEYIQSEEWNSMTQNYTNIKIKELLSESGGEIFASVLTPAMTQVIQSLRQQLGY